MHYKFMGVNIDSKYGIVVRNDLGVIQNIDAKENAKLRKILLKESPIERPIILNIFMYVFPLCVFF